MTVDGEKEVVDVVVEVVVRGGRRARTSRSSASILVCLLMYEGEGCLSSCDAGVLAREWGVGA